MLPRKKIRNLRSSKCWKCIQIVIPTTTTLVLYHFKSFTISSGGPFWLLGGGGVRAHPAHPPAYGPETIVPNGHDRLQKGKLCRLYSSLLTVYS